MAMCVSGDKRVTPVDRRTGTPENDDLVDLRRLLRVHADALRGDAELLAELGLRPEASNIVEFGPVALSRVNAAHQRESGERKRLEAMARANFVAQAQTHAAVIDMLEARNLAYLARRVDELARLRFDLSAGVVALEGPGDSPPGWLALVEGQVDLVLGPRKLARMGHFPTAVGLFGDLAPVVGSVALVRLAIWQPARQGLVAFASTDPAAFSADMGAELVTFLARVLERTTERWTVG